MKERTFSGYVDVIYNWDGCVCALKEVTLPMSGAHR